MKKQAEGLATEYNRLADQLNVSAFVFVLKPDLPKKKKKFFFFDCFNILRLPRPRAMEPAARSPARRTSRRA